MKRCPPRRSSRWPRPPNRLVVGRWIFGTRFEDYVALGRSDLQLHVNLSPSKSWMLISERSHRGQRESGIDPAKVCLELTALEPMPAYMAPCRHARDLPIPVWPWDFGVEYASMTNLMHVPVDWLKIDRSFVDPETNVSITGWFGPIAVAAAMETKLIAEVSRRNNRSECGMCSPAGLCTVVRPKPKICRGFRDDIRVSARHGTSEGEGPMKLATRLAILCGSAILNPPGCCHLQLADRRISDLFAQRFEARGEQITTLGVDRDLQDLMSTFERLLYVKDPVRRAKLTAELDELDKSVDGGLRRAAEAQQDHTVGHEI